MLTAYDCVDATALAARVAARQVSPTELLDHALGKVAALNPRLPVATA